MNPYKQFILFTISGSIAAIIALVFRFLLGSYLSFYYAVPIAQFISMAFGYISFKYIVFKKYNGNTREIIKFLIVNGFGFLQVTFLSFVFLELMNNFLSVELSEFIAHLFALSTLLFTSYFLHKKFTFN